MSSWTASIYSDGTDCFISNPTPTLGETVTVSIRFYKDAPVKEVYLRTVPNGSESLIKMEKIKEENGFIYYGAPVYVNEPEIPYHFYLVTDDKIYFYNQKEVSTFFPDRIYDFKLLADYDQPSWVKESVFYQIFPDRFYNGNPDNDVQDEEFYENGHPSIKYKDWNTKPLNYFEGYCMDFYGGDLEGITQKIPYLKNLGVTALYLNPIFIAPSSHKYNCIDYFHVDEHLGGDKALVELTDACHKNGLHLILDISINHTGANHIWFNRDGEFYEQSVGAFNNPDSEERLYYFFKEGSNVYKGWFDLPDMPTLNYTSNKLRDIVYKDEDSVIKKWLKQPYNIDGWRFDVADVFCRNDALQLSHEVWPEIRKSIKSENPKAYILAEDWDDSSEHLKGDEWDSAMNYYGCARVLRQYIGAPELFLERSNGLKDFNMKITAYDVRDRINTYLAKLPFVIAENQFNLIDSHDVSRLHNHKNINREDYRGAVILQFMLIGAPSIYYGDEALIDGTTDSNEGCRYPMPWGSNFEAKSNFKLYQKLSHLKTSIPALKQGGMKFIYSDENSMALARLYKDSIIIAVNSISNFDKTITLDIKQLGAHKPVDSIDMLGQPFEFTQIEDGTIELNLPAHKNYLIDCSNY